MPHDPHAVDAARIVSDYEAYLFGEGHWFRAWEKMGARPATIDGISGYSFVVWAPNARGVSVVGDFNQWDGRTHPLRSLGVSGLWETFLPGMTAGTLYKFEIHPRVGPALHQGGSVRLDGGTRATYRVGHHRPRPARMAGPHVDGRAPGPPHAG